MFKKQITLIICLFVNSYVMLNAQSETDFLINQTFSSNIGFICEETPDDNACAGLEVYLILNFSKEMVSIIEKDVSNCGDEFITFKLNCKWIVTQDSELKIEANPEDIKYQFIKDLVLKIENKAIVGYKEIGTKKTDKFEFKKQL